MHLLFRMNIMHDFICTGIAELWEMVRVRNIQNENICLQLDLNFQRFTPFEC